MKIDLTDDIGDTGTDSKRGIMFNNVVSCFLLNDCQCAFDSCIAAKIQQNKTKSKQTNKIKC